MPSNSVFPVGLSQILQEGPIRPSQSRCGIIFQYPQSSSQVTCFLKSSQLFPPLPRPEKNLVSPSEFPPCNVPLIEHHPVLCRGQCLPPTKHPEPSPHSPFINRTQFYSDIHSSCMRLRDGDPILSIKGRS